MLGIVTVNGLPTPAAIAIGAIAGVLARWGVFGLLDDTLDDGRTIVVNAVGCLLMGLFVRQGWRDDLHAAATVGFCGGLTTFSTFALDSAIYFEQSDWLQGVIYVAATVLVSAITYLVGRQLAGAPA